MRRITHLDGSAYFTIPLTAEAVTGGPAMVETEFTESKCSGEIIDEKRGRRRWITSSTVTAIS